MTKADVARQYREKYGEKMPSLKLARIMYKKEPLLFNDVDHARSTLRAIEGKAGSKSKKAAINSGTLKEARPYNPYKLPESDESDYSPFMLKGHSRILGLFDVHAPYHSISALTAALDFARKEKPDGIVLGGDFWDFHGLSKYLKDPRKKRFAEEIRIGTDLIKAIQSATKGVPIYYKLGNHCERYQHYLWQKLGELEGIEDFQLEELINRRVSGVTVIGDKRIIKANNLNIVHGHEFAQSIISPVNIARSLYLKAKASSICGHHHRTSAHTEQDINGKIVATWSVGCLSELHPRYMPINSWNHGFCLIDLASNKKDFEVRNKTIFKGRVL